MTTTKHLAVALIFLFLFAFAKEASASTLYLSPGSGSVSKGSILTTSLGLNTAGEGVNGISAFLSYPADKLEVTSISYGGSFAIAAEGSFGGGSIRISRGSINPVSGSVNIATINFRAKSEGSATVSITGGAVPRASDSSDSYSGGSGGTYNITASSQAAPKTASPQSTTSSQSAPAVSIQKPLITEVKVSNLATNSATITWKTDQYSSSVLEYGLEKGNYFLTVANDNLVTNHSIELKSPLLTPGAKIHFRPVSKDGFGNTTQGEDIQFQLKGYKIQLKIADKTGIPFKNTQVYLYSEADKKETNQNGQVEFEDVTLGKHLAVIKLSFPFEKTAEIEVKENSQIQYYNLQMPVAAGVLSVFNPFVLAGVVVLALLVAIFIIYRYRKAHPAARNNAT